MSRYIFALRDIFFTVSPIPISIISAVMILNRIKSLRNAVGMKQSELADIVKYRQNTVSNWETGRSDPPLDALEKMSSAFNVSIDYILGCDEKEPSPIPSVGSDSARSHLMAAFWGGEKDLSQEELDDMWNDVERFAAFLAEKKRQEKKNG